MWYAALNRCGAIDVLCHVSPHLACEHGTATSHDESGGIAKKVVQDSTCRGESVEPTPARKDRKKEKRE